MSINNKKKQIIASCISIDSITNDDISDLLISPPSQDLGDFALPCFRFAKILKKSPLAIAEDLAQSISEANKNKFASIIAVNGYLNFKFNPLESAKQILAEILEKKSGFGSSTIGAGKTICIDYSSINIAKPLHIGHLSSTIIGSALYKVYKKLGYNAVGINHLGDWGTQFGKLIVAFDLWGNMAALKKEQIPYLSKIYVKFHEEAQNQPELNDQARAAFKKLEDGDLHAIELYSVFKKITLQDVAKIYKILHVHFDSLNGEAFFNDKMTPVIDELNNLKLTEISDDALVVRLSDYDMPPCILIRSDGATLYATRDLAAAYYRKEKYDFHKCLYVVAYQQNLHFKQIFKVLELAGKKWAKDMVHVPFGMVSLEDGAMSTRKGNVILLKDVIDKSIEKSLVILKSKSPKLKNKRSLATKIGVGAVVFFALSNNRIKDIIFSYDKILSFDGETAPYVQYTNVRALSVLKNMNVDLNKYFTNHLTDDELKGLDNKESALLVSLFEKFPDILSDVLDKYEPSILTRYIIDVAKAFNKFYLENRILNAPDEFKRSRAALTYATHIIICEGLKLLGIDTPEEM
ncbi:MAG: arginine--tRNA ligase [Christensenellaceae bacterium]|jgi:arginyl-tRNA synthetase|nr:arginine--tRNA ligase [Christensenellaceae bacterium]